MGSSEKEKPAQGGQDAEFSAWDDIKFSLAIFAFWIFPVAFVVLLVWSLL